MDVVLVTGGFDPLHSGHLAYFKAAKELGDKLVVGINSDEWLTRKKGRPFMPFQERAEIIKGLSIVDQIISFDDSDDTACGAIYKTLATHGDIKIIFANGGDRTDANIPEMSTYESTRYVDFVFGVGGEDKKNSSSWILKEWKAPKIEREWGHYRELYQGEGFQVKELVIAPHSKLSMQRHEHRSETWNIVSGNAHVKMNFTSGNPFDGCAINKLHPSNPLDIPKSVWHQGCNDSDEPAHIVEVWKGKTDKLIEDDIERYDP
jgi:cytidyltransferase-like protein